MSTNTREERLARRITDLYATDQQFADARPSEAVAHAIEAPELSLPQIVQTVVDGYADRPALRALGRGALSPPCRQMSGPRRRPHQRAHPRQTQLLISGGSSRCTREYCTALAVSECSSVMAAGASA